MIVTMQCSWERGPSICQCWHSDPFLTAPFEDNHRIFSRDKTKQFPKIQYLNPPSFYFYKAALWCCLLLKVPYKSNWPESNWIELSTVPFHACITKSHKMHDVTTFLFFQARMTSLERWSTCMQNQESQTQTCELWATVICTPSTGKTCWKCWICTLSSLTTSLPTWSSPLTWEMRTLR